MLCRKVVKLPTSVTVILNEDEIPNLNTFWRTGIYVFRIIKIITNIDVNF